MARTRTGDFNLRIVVLRRVLGTPGANNEPAESWPEPMPGTGEYFAARERVSGNEVVAQAIRQSVGFLRLRIRGRSIPVEAVDRVRLKVTGAMYQVVAEPLRDGVDTVIDLELVVPREAAT